MSSAPTSWDPSSGGNLFAARLASAISQRGLSLNRLQARLEAMGVGVSVATLSYWSSGRSLPTRGRSLSAVEALEQILQVAPGWLSTPLSSRPGDLGLGALFPQGLPVREAAASLEAPSSRFFRRPWLRYTAVLDETGVDVEYVTEQVVVAETDGIDLFTVVHDQATDEAEARLEALEGLTVDELTRPAPGTLVAQLRLARPLAQGETAHLRHRLVTGSPGRRVEEVSFALARPVDLLVIEVTCPGAMPRAVRRSHQDPDAPGATPIEQQVMVEPGRVHCVVPTANAGVHTLHLDWGAP